MSSSALITFLSRGSTFCFHTACPVKQWSDFSVVVPFLACVQSLINIWMRFEDISVHLMLSFVRSRSGVFVRCLVFKKRKIAQTAELIFVLLDF